MISTIVCRGYGAFGGGVHLVPTFGYSSGTPVSLVKGPVCVTAGKGYSPGSMRGKGFSPGSTKGKGGC